MQFTSIKYSNQEKPIPKFEVLDQLLIPVEKVYIPVKTVDDTWRVIRDMNVRGAPLIAIVAVLGLTVEAIDGEVSGRFSTKEAFFDWFKMSIDHLRTSRPTAVNLFTAMNELEVLINRMVDEKKKTSEIKEFVTAIQTYSENLLAEDVATNKRMGAIGADAVVAATGKSKDIRMLTICNTGSLATAGFGTALGVIRSLHSKGILEKVYACETRPYNQGSRLTAFELVEDGLPGCLITDSMASSLMKNGSVDAVVVGADRVAANGDTANKIGTYQLAVACKHHGIPFFVASPLTTVDLNIQSGSQIPIEERSPLEVTHVKGIQIAPTDIEVWNPGFDVTPSDLINGIITEKGVAPRVNATIDMPGFLSQVNAEEVNSNSEDKVNMESFDTLSYTDMNNKKLLWYLKTYVPDQWQALGGSTTMPIVKEVGDGNLNLVFIVSSSCGNYSTIVKQALPYVRCVGESWPFTLDRAYFEFTALSEEAKCLDGCTLVPEVYHFNRTLALMVMRYIEPPHIILRKSLIQNEILPTLAHDVAHFLAHTLLKTSSIFLSGKEFREKVSFWSKNSELCELTESVIFTEPYIQHSNNNFLAEIESVVVNQIQNSKINQNLIERVTYFKQKFVTCAEALLHGDLHTGSIMCKPSSSFVIDPEFAFYGPMGFDLGLYIGNMFLSFFSQKGHQNNQEYSEWVLNEIRTVWILLKEKMTAMILEKESGAAGKDGEMLRGAPGLSDTSKSLFIDSFFRSLLSDSMGYAACEMIRRIVGIAGVEDLQTIENSTKRASCEKRALALAVRLLCAFSDNSISPDQGFEEVIAFAKLLDNREVENIFTSSSN